MQGSSRDNHDNDSLDLLSVQQEKCSHGCGRAKHVACPYCKEALCLDHMEDHHEAGCEGCNNHGDNSYSRFLSDAYDDLEFSMTALTTDPSTPSTLLEPGPPVKEPLARSGDVECKVAPVKRKQPSCKRCHVFFDTGENYQEHKVQVHKARRRTWLYCYEKDCDWPGTDRRSKVREHKAGKHGLNGTYTCPFPECANHSRKDGLFAFPSNLSQHIYAHHGKKRICCYCLKTWLILRGKEKLTASGVTEWVSENGFDNEGGLKAHKKREHAQQHSDKTKANTKGNKSKRQKKSHESPEPNDTASRTQQGSIPSVVQTTPSIGPLPLSTKEEEVWMSWFD